jgi:hypothetical protein
MCFAFGKSPPPNKIKKFGKGESIHSLHLLFGTRSLTSRCFRAVSISTLTKSVHREKQQYARGPHLGCESRSQVNLSSSHLIPALTDYAVDIHRVSPGSSHQTPLTAMDAMDLDPQQLSQLTAMDAEELSFRVGAMQFSQESTKRQHDKRKWNSFNRQADGRRVMKKIYEVPKQKIRIFPHHLFLSDIGVPFTTESLKEVLSAYGLEYNVRKKMEQWAKEGRQAVREMMQRMGQLAVIEEMEE